MVILSLNIIGNGPYNNIPFLYQFENRSGTIQWIREQAFNIVLWSHDNYGIKSNLKIGLNIIEDDLLITVVPVRA